MGKCRSFWLVVLFVLALSASMGIAAQAPSPQNRPHVTDEIIVKFRAGSDEYSKVMTHFGVGGTRARVFRILEGLELIKLPRGLSVQRAIELYQRHPDVLYAEPNYIVKTTNTPNDTRFAEQWALHNTGQAGGTPGADVDASRAWDLTTGSSAVIVAVIDSGVDYNHPDLFEHVSQQP
jgi:subtilisin family serine protease